MRQWIQFLRRPKPDTVWEWHETSSGPVMRRRFNGEWEVRAMKPDELHDYEGSRAGW